MKIKKLKINVINSIRVKLIVMTSALLIIPLLVTGLLSYEISKMELDKQSQVILKNSVRQAMMLIHTKQKQVFMGLLSAKDAKEEVKNYLLALKDKEGKRPINKDIDLGENGYFIIYGENGFVIAHSSLEEQNLWDADDKSNSNFKFAQEQIKAAMNGGGFVKYTWTLPNSEKIEEKITYQEYDPSWGWIVSAGSYKQDYDKGARKILQLLFITIAVSMGLGLMAIIVFSRQIAVPIQKISRNLEEVSKGNLHIDELNIANNDETGILAKAFNVMLRNMREIISTMKGSAATVMKLSYSLATITDETTSAITEVATAIQEVAQAVGEEASSTENAVTRVAVLADNIEGVTNSSVDMSQIAAETGKLSDRGLQAVDTLIITTDKNNKATDKINEVIKKVSESSNKIDVITETITEISQQTNLLALNASIEAARAGHAGRGFAVVADEIRKLAEQSEKAVKEIKDIIGEIHMYSDSSIETMELVKSVSKQQNAAVDDTKNVFIDITDAIKNLMASIDKISIESISMKNMKDEIVAIIENIAASTQQTSAVAQEVTASSEEQLAAIEEVSSHTHELKVLSAQLEEAVEQFKV
ncbi:MAG: methyl-accepting chemotaxis protein [Bacillota bacterium]